MLKVRLLADCKDIVILENKKLKNLKQKQNSQEMKQR